MLTFCANFRWHSMHSYSFIPLCNFMWWRNACFVFMPVRNKAYIAAWWRSSFTTLPTSSIQKEDSAWERFKPMATSWWKVQNVSSNLIETTFVLQLVLENNPHKTFKKSKKKGNEGLLRDFEVSLSETNYDLCVYSMSSFFKLIWLLQHLKNQPRI